MGSTAGVDIFEKKNSLTPTGIQAPDCPASSLVTTPTTNLVLLQCDATSVGNELPMFQRNIVPSTLQSRRPRRITLDCIIHGNEGTKCGESTNDATLHPT